MTGHKDARGHHKANRQVPKALNPKRVIEARNREKRDRRETRAKRPGQTFKPGPTPTDWTSEDDFMLGACPKCLDTGIMVIAGIDTDCPDCT